MFRRITSSLSRISPDRYLLAVVLSIVVLSCANLLFCTVRYEFGMDEFGMEGFTSPLSGPDGPNDRFADLIKVSFSYRSFVSGISPETVRSWPEIYKRYYVSPQYRGVDALAQGTLVTHFHQPPLTTLHFLGSATFISHTQSILLTILLYFGVYLAAVECALMAIPAPRRTVGVLLAIWTIALVSYPALLIFTRGNYQSGVTSLFIAAFMLCLFLRNRPEPLALLALAIAMNFRPNAILFALAIPLVVGFKQSVKPIIYLGTLASGVFAASYFAVNSLYPDYTMSTFLQGLNVYKKLYALGKFGDYGNASLWGLVKNFGRISADLQHSMALIVPSVAVLLVVLLWRAPRLRHWTITAPLASLLLYFQFVAVTGNNKHYPQAFTVLALYLAANVGWTLWRCRPQTRILIAPFVLTACYCLLCPVFAEYHLLVFLVPVILLYFNQQEWADNPRIMAAVAMASILMLAPKNYIYAGGLSFQTLLNPLVMYFTVLYITREARSIPESADEELFVRSSASLTPVH
jgi:hypothetical protein